MQNAEQCGQVKISHRGNIVGGVRVQKGEFPWLVAFFDKSETSFCAGTLLSHLHVLSGNLYSCIDSILHTDEFHKSRELKIVDVNGLFSLNFFGS